MIALISSRDKVAEDGPVEALDGNRENALRDGQQGWLA